MRNMVAAFLFWGMIFAALVVIIAKVTGVVW